MPKPLDLTRLQARRLLLAYQYLYPPRQLQGNNGVLEYISRVNCIQFDPLDIVGHNPELVLQSRIAGFQPEQLNELLYQDRRLIDGWDKMMSIYRVEDWPYFARYRQHFLKRLGEGRSAPIMPYLTQIRNIVEAKGPVSSIDLDFDQKVDWPWAPTRLSRAALESLYHCGELVIHHKVRTRKVYDLSARHLPSELLGKPDPNLSQEQYQDWYVFRRLCGVGILRDKTGDAWLGMHFIKSPERLSALKRLLGQRRIREIRIEGNGSFFIPEFGLKLSEHIDNNQSLPNQASIIAPLDNLLWDRVLVEKLFDFRYRWEVYKPEREREYGYYVLPVLYGDRFIARFEPGRPRNGSLEIKNWWWEAGVDISEELCTALSSCFQGFLKYLNIDSIQISAETRQSNNLTFLNNL